MVQRAEYGRGQDPQEDAGRPGAPGQSDEYSVPGSARWGNVRDRAGQGELQSAARAASEEEWPGVTSRLEAISKRSRLWA